VSTSNELKSIDVIEFGSNFVAKQPPGSSRRNSPCANVLGIAPYQIAKSAFMRDLLRTSNDADLVEGTNLRTQATVNTENFAVDDCTENEEVEDLAAGFPDRGVSILLLTFFVETVDLSYLA